MSPHVQRFVTGLSLGLILAICLACSQRVLLSADPAMPGMGPTAEVRSNAAREGGSAIDGVADQGASADSSVSDAALTEAPVLSAAAQAVIASAGPEGLYNPPRKDVRLVVFSDLNSAYGSTDYDPEVDKAVALVPFWQPDAVVCSGDMVAGQQRTLTVDQINAMWQAFDDHVAAPLRDMGVPYGFTLGNHDASAARNSSGQFIFQQERDLASAYWNTPAHDPGVNFIDRTDFPFFYTFEQNGVFFMAWDGSSSQIPADKLAWVEAALSSEAAQSAKARMVLSHLPLYGVAQRRDQPGEVLANAPQLQAILERHNVHTLISGHQHAYYPAHRGNLQLLHAGLLGSGPRALIDGSAAPWKALTVIDIDFADPALTTYTTYDITTLRRVDDTTLPRFLVSHNGLILRRDVQYSDLTPADKARCQQRLSADQCVAGRSTPILATWPQRPTYAA
ncbi:metallophosphoesterase [Leptolyngbya sp. BL0902]|nr:metallophosphoesterase [Leptolyngbya sp. BL0902]